MTYNEIFTENNITLFTEHSGFTAQEAIAKIQSDSEKPEMFIYCSDINCSGIYCSDCLLHLSNADKLLLWLQQFVSKPDTITYFNNEEFEEGDLVIVTAFKDNPDYTTIGDWIHNGEIIRLGGKYWSSNSPLKLKNGEEIICETIKYPLGNSTCLYKPETIKIRHATPEEITYYNKVGLGANINDMKKEETILTKTQPEPKFKVGDIVTFKDRKDCEYKDGQIGKYWFSGENYGGKKVPVIKVLDFVPVKNCYKIEVASGHTLNYIMLECEFQEYDAKKIETSGTPEPIAKKGDYVVFLQFLRDDKEINISGSIPINHCYCLAENFEFTTSTFRVEKDINGNTNNSYLESKNRHIITRPATSEEIAEYKRLDKPFDVTQPYLLLREQLTDKENIVDTYQFIPSKLPQFPQQKNKYIIEIQEEEPIFLGSKPTFKQLIK